MRVMYIRNSDAAEAVIDVACDSERGSELLANGCERPRWSFGVIHAREPLCWSPVLVRSAMCLARDAIHTLDDSDLALQLIDAALSVKEI